MEIVTGYYESITQVAKDSINKNAYNVWTKNTRIELLKEDRNGSKVLFSI